MNRKPSSYPLTEAKIRSLLACALSLLVLVGAASTPSAYADSCDIARVDVCFRPGLISCADKITSALDGAHLALVIQAYNFTAPSIIQAIKRAKDRGVDVKVLLDRENRRQRYTGAAYLTNAGVAVRIDDKVAIAHNKIIVVDNALVVGGSYNYTTSAEQRNTENVTFIRSKCVADLFEENFYARWKLSTPLATTER